MYNPGRNAVAEKIMAIAENNITFLLRFCPASNIISVTENRS
jgi:hypothetical protein